MELKCPHCGKIVNMSPEELVSGNEVVICPQCLGDFFPTGVNLSGIAGREQEQKSGEDKKLFCHHCGKSLPVFELNFCPFCGKSLQFDVDKHAKASPTALGNRSNVTHEASEKKVEQEERVIDELNIERLKYMPKFISGDFASEPASLTVRIICYIVIALLIALFVLIIYAGSRG